MSCECVRDIFDKVIINRLHGYAKKGDSWALERLIPHYPVSEKDEYGMTPLKYACIKGNEECVKMLIEAMDEENPEGLFMACIHDHHHLVKYFKDVPRNGQTALMYACRHDSVNCAKELLGNQDYVDADGRTAYHVAALWGSIKCLSVLKAVSSKDKNGYTPIMLATMMGHTKIVEKLLLAQWRGKSNEGMSIIHYAIRNDDVEIALMLAFMVASTNAEGENAVQYANRLGGECSFALSPFAFLAEQHSTYYNSDNYNEYEK